MACGVRRPKPASQQRDTNRIVGGNDASSRDYPWSVTIQDEKQIPNQQPKFKDSCGASIISDRVLLTAAHCMSAYQRGMENAKRKGIWDNRMAINFRFVVGCNDLRGEDLDGCDKKSVYVHRFPHDFDIHLHPWYNGGAHDIALIIIRHQTHPKYGGFIQMLHDQLVLFV